MKKILFTAIIMLLCLSFVSCRTNNKINFLSYQAYPFDAHGILTYDGAEYEVLITVQRAGDVILQIIKPDILSDTVFELNGGEVIVKAGELTQTINDGGYSASDGILLSAYMFSLSGNNFSKAGIITEAGVKYSYAEYAVPCGSVTVFIQNGLSSPEKLTATLNGHEFSFVFMNES